MHKSLARRSRRFMAHLPDTLLRFADEYRRRGAVAIFDTNWHTIVELTGPDRVRYLNAIVSNDLKRWRKDAARWPCC